MVKCSYCKKNIPSDSRYYKGKKGGKYHISCGRKAGVKGLTIKWTRKKKNHYLDMPSNVTRDLRW